MATGDSFYEDEYLLSLLRQGSQDAFTQIYNKYYSMLYSLSCKYLQDRELAEDGSAGIFAFMGIPFFCLHYSESEKLPLYNGEESCSEYDS